ncbi:MAG: hypothetical protein Q8K58_05200 [Acidimicrobiales bacterium]|nr:hypothetical protein [Acidimicrobiales bacterium]
MRPRLLASLAVLCLVAACSEADDSPLADDTRSSSTTEAPTATTDEKAGDDAPPGDAATVELLDPGSEPRRPLRLAPAEGCSVGRTLRQSGEIVVDAGEAAGTSQQSTRSVTEQDLTYRCAEVSDERIELELGYGGGRVIEADPSSQSVLEDVLGAFEGATGSVAFDDHGQILGSTPPDIDLPGALQAVGEQLTEGLEAQAAALAVPFPEEAVGHGARWRVTSNGVLGGLTFNQTTTFTITSIEGDIVTADNEITMELPPGPVELPDSVGSSTAEVIEGRLTGTGTTTWNLAEVVPYGVQVLEGDIVTAIEAGGEALTLRQHQRTQTEIRPR